jgi:hypothetical protein
MKVREKKKMGGLRETTGKVFEEITLRDSGKGTRTTLVDLSSDTMIKYKNLYVKDIKSGKEREREREQKYVMDYIVLRLNY